MATVLKTVGRKPAWVQILPPPLESLSKIALVAQWIEHQLAVLGVRGSSPLERALVTYRLQDLTNRSLSI